MRWICVITNAFFGRHLSTQIYRLVLIDKNRKYFCFYCKEDEKMSRKYFLYILFHSIAKNIFSDRPFTDTYDMLYFYILAFLYNIPKYFKGKLFTSEICPF